MIRSPAVGSKAILLRPSRERPRTAVPYVPESVDKQLREAAAPRKSAVPRISNSRQGRPNRREANNNEANGGLGQTDFA